MIYSGLRPDQQAWMEGGRSSPYNAVKVITTHFNADFDALSSMVAAKKLYPDAVLVFPGSQEKTVRNFLIHSTLYFLNIAKMKEIDHNSVDTLILVDTRQKNRIGDFARLIEGGRVKVHVYDHHPPALDDVAGDVEVVGDSGACVSITRQSAQREGTRCIARRGDRHDARHLRGDGQLPIPFHQATSISRPPPFFSPRAPTSTSFRTYSSRIFLRSRYTCSTS